MSRDPKVFLSSVLGGLEEYRGVMSDIITEKFGWECYPFGIRNERYVGTPKTACLREVEKADLYVGLFWKRGGSTIHHDNMPITELECRHAINKRKSMLVYVVEANPEEVDIDVNFLIQTISEPDNGLCIRFCKNFGQVIYQLNKDLEYFGNCWAAGKTDLWTINFLLDNVLEDLGLYIERPEAFRLSRVPQKIRLPIDRGYILQRVDDMRIHFDRHEFAKTVEIGIELLVAFHSIGISRKKRDLLPSWAKFLRMWAGSCNWLNLIGGPLGSVEASRMLMETYHVLGMWHFMYEAAGVISNCSYVESRALDNKKMMLEVVTPSGRKSTTEIKEQRAYVRLQKKLEEARQVSLRRALDYDKFFIERYRPAGVNLYRAYIYQVQGNYDQAISDFELMAYDKSSSSNEMSYLDTLTDLGYTKVLKAIKGKSSKGMDTSLLEEGMRHLREAHEGVQRYSSSPWYLIIEKGYAKGLIQTGDRKGARKHLDRIYRKAMQEGLTQQAESINILANKAAG